ncbi:acetoacetate decarboxylase family protein [Leucobacter komagatae]|uniref:Acetoacetate decarboxylase n=1 Tax=Leucobacter komagatae TaxID=55969 RepID=A0A0D0IQ75_9MICO|nr:acetoacetate decarboxylase family protein [Leucobacter komagatae]KIP51633.1 acetoacetate decarboxylase [Leucobacter komagatae]
MTEPTGFLFPRSPEGRADIIAAPPWHYSGTWLTVEYRTNPDNVRALLPPQLGLDEDDPGRVAMVFADWQSCTDGGEELLDPVQSQYSEAFLAVKATYGGKIYTRIAYIWVDRDFSLGRGIHMGYPKKFGSIYQTRPFPYGPAPRIAPDNRFGASLASYDRRIAEARITLREQAETGPTVNVHPLLHSRLLRSIEKGQPDSLDELITHGPIRAEGSKPWLADAELRLFDSPVEELANVKVDEVLGGYYQQLGTVWDGGTLLSPRLSSEDHAS